MSFLSLSTLVGAVVSRGSLGRAIRLLFPSTAGGASQVLAVAVPDGRQKKDLAFAALGQSHL